MKPFDIELAKAGYPVCTRDGRPVRILCFDRKSVDGYSILALVDEGVFTDDGNVWHKIGIDYL